MRESWEHNGKTQSFVIDYDDLKGINTIEDFLTVHIAKNMPLPYYVAQTGPNNFHSLYSGKYNEWPQKKILWLLYKWAGIEQPTNDYVELYNKFLESGIDTNYYSQHYGKHKIRIPGSINKNHIKEDGSFWQVVGWINNKYDNADKQYYEEIARPRPNFIPSENVVSISSKKAIPNKFKPDVFVDSIEAILKDLFPNGFCVPIDKLSFKISSNIGWLIKNECKIVQKKWAEELGCKQFDISRIIKRLIEKDILSKVNDFYIKGQFPKTYGAGERLRESINWVGNALPHPEWVRWDEGTSNKRMLYDVRYFISIGLNNEEIIQRLHERQAHRPSKKTRSTNDFLRCINNVREWNRTHSGIENKDKDYALSWWM